MITKDVSKLILLTILLHQIGLEVKGQSKEEANFDIKEEQEGTIKIHATKDAAEVNTEADSVKVSVDPGVLLLDKEKDDEKEKVKSRSSLPHIFGIEEGTDVAKDTLSLFESPKPQGKRSLDHFRKALLQGQRTFENSVMLENWKQKNQYLINRNLKRAKKALGSRSTVRAVKVFHPQSFSSGQRLPRKRRKSQIEKEMRVHGRSGSLHVHTALDETRLVSKSGELDVFIKNPKPNEIDSANVANEGDEAMLVSEQSPHILNFERSSASRKSYDRNKQSKTDLHYREINMPDTDFTGLKKSNIDRDVRRYKSRHGHPCVVPPCTT